jgi:DNA invertase Pin-like site-specific DNA recombinase
MMIGYARVSTLDQNAELQLDELRAAGCTKIFIDEQSGLDRDRPELAKALGYVRKGDTLCCWKLDRIARSLLHLLEISADLEKRGVGFRILTGNIDTTNAVGRLMFQMVGAFAEFEHSLMRERTMAGLAAARARGRVGGRPRKHPLVQHVQERAAG